MGRVSGGVCRCETYPDFRFERETASEGADWCFDCLERAARGTQKSVTEMMDGWEKDGWLRIDLGRPQARLI